MSDSDQPAARRDAPTSAAVAALLVLTGVMLVALFSRTPPHPPLEVAPFALGPFLGGSLGIGAAAWHLLRQDARHGNALAVVFALTALVSFGPQKYFDPAFFRIWPAVITAQVSVVVILVRSIVGRRDAGRRSDRVSRPA
jgi:peptidoglycan/LPS O-acetylase OafA/YrhL